MEWKQHEYPTIDATHEEDIFFLGPSNLRGENATTPGFGPHNERLCWIETFHEFIVLPLCRTTNNRNPTPPAGIKFPYLHKKTSTSTQNMFSNSLEYIAPYT
jgi:hypothetical protein